MRLGTRVALAAVAPAAILAAALLLVVDRKLASQLHANLVRKGEALAVTLSEQAAAAVLAEDVVAAQRLLACARRSDPAVRYAYLVDAAGRPVAHTFPSGVPESLLEPPRAQGDGAGRRRPRVRPLTSEEEGPVYEVAAPLLCGRLGTLHVGLATRETDAVVAETRWSIASLAAALLVLAAGASIAVAAGIARPVADLCLVTERAGRGDLGARAREVGPREIAALAHAWNEAAASLEHRTAELRALEAYQARLLDGMGDAICVIRPDRTLEYANALARGPGGEPNGRPCSEVFRHAGNRPCAHCPLERVLETGEPALRRHEAPDGTVSEVSFLRLERTDETRAVVERSRDVTEHVRLERRLVALERLALLGEVAAGIAHEIGNPIGGIRGCLEVVGKSEADQGRARKFLGLAAQGLDRLEAIVRGLLASTRPLPLRKREVSLDDVCEQALLLVGVRVERRGVRLVRRRGDGVPHVEADPDALCQVVLNLVLNALDAIEAKGAGEGEVVVETLARNGGAPAAGIRVNDDGTGIAPEILDKVGTPFFTTKPAGRGTGLGLSTSRGVAEQHGGRLEIENRPGRGASFTVWVPATAGGGERACVSAS